jgi:hypothetical protein
MKKEERVKSLRFEGRSLTSFGIGPDYVGKR